ncbi:MAG TPA: xanthine dehydrogenase family protein molybdopterin-binding subunit [Acidobacteriota bacterium]|nr:xanthine dehydrogenase family protein molybdopterin-binding subunit [Acidobacteriota bacterium]
MKFPATALYSVAAFTPANEERSGQADTLKAWDQTKVVGKALPRVDGYERVSGAAVYPSDVKLPNMLYGAILRCPHPRAKVKSIDTSRAERIPGVRKIITGSTPGCDLNWYYSRNVSTKLFDTNCLFEGDEVAAVAAESPYLAADALRAIAVDYEVLPFVADEQRALDPQAPKVHEKGNQVGEVEKYERGDVAKGFAEADVIVEETYSTACQLHTTMEGHGCVANWNGDELVIWESTQGVFPVQEEVARTLGLPQSKVRVIGHYMGGGFGSKLQSGKYSVIAALLAKQTGRPVKLFLTREETYLAVGNRPPAHMKIKAGARKDGTLTALEFTCLGTGGAFPSGGVSLDDWLVRDLYNCPNVRTEMTDVFINAGPARPMRAPGHPQGAWALEQMMDTLAEKLGMDPVELRIKNVPKVSLGRPGSPPYTTTGLRQCLEDGARVFGWADARKKRAESQAQGDIRRGVGMAAALWIGGSGSPPSTVLVKVFADGSVNLNLGASDIGTGTKTVMAMVVAEELGIDPNAVQIENADTGTTQYTDASGGSKTVPTEAPAVRSAAVEVKKQLLEMAAAELKVDVSDLEVRNGEVVSVTDPTKKKKFAELRGLRRAGVVLGVGRRGPNPPGKVINPFAAQFCEVEVNVKTGEIKVIRFVAAHDSGRVMNRLTYQNQVFGGITMGAGLALTEERILDREQTGKMLNTNFHEYKLPTAADIPADMVCIPIDLNDTEANSTGAKGLGEPATIPTAAAIANAVYDAIGVRITDSPITPMKVLAKLGDAAKTRQQTEVTQPMTSRKEG